MSYVYILQCSDGSYYVGSTTNLQLRLQEHSEGKSSYTNPTFACMKTTTDYTDSTDYFTGILSQSDGFLGRAKRQSRAHRFQRTAQR